MAGALLGRAFHDDPLWGATFSDPDRRPELLVAMFTGLTKTTVAAQGLAETTPDLDAVALWLPPGKDFGFWAMAKSGFALPRFAMSLPAQDRNRMMAVLRQFGKRKKALMPDPHWYLAAIGVDPERQGEGLGSTLVQAGIRRADQENTSVYLETETEGNVGLYQHLGFDVIEQVTATGLCLPVWLMMRRPPSLRT
jgi:ribosomal protein S18 acetylase RimI-like enzyme